MYSNGKCIRTTHMEINTAMTLLKTPVTAKSSRRTSDRSGITQVDITVVLGVVLQTDQHQKKTKTYML